MLTPTQQEARDRRHKFHAAIAARAAALEGGVRLEDRRPFCRRAGTVRIDIHQEPETDTSIEIRHVDCEVIFLSTVSMVRMSRAPTETGGIKISDIQKVVAREYGITRSEMISRRRDKAAMIPRQIAMYLAHKMTLNSWPEIGRRFNKCDHTSPWHASKKIERLLLTNAALAARIEDLKFKIRAEAA